MCVKSKNDQSGQDGAALATLPRRQYESFFVVKKLSVVVRWARRRLKADIKVHLIHALHFEIKVTFQVKGRSKVTMNHFHLLSSQVS